MRRGTGAGALVPTVLAVLAVLALLALAATACGTDSTGLRQPGADAAAVIDAQVAGGPLRSIVQLGDSIASGEGTLYGYRWDADAKEWTGGNLDARWPPPYPDCHDSPDAYGNGVARHFDASFVQLACTGSTFANGISAPRTDADGTQYRPAQFGNWSTRTDLDPEYDGAAPDLVLITLGADDVQFSAIVEHCVKNGYEYYFDLADLECTKANPGSTVETDFFDALETLEADYATLVQWIAERAAANGAPAPKVVITNYANPLPADGTICNDTSYFYAEQVEYLSSLVDEMNQVIERSVEAMDPAVVRLADISEAYEVQGTSHAWCSDDPWAYGMSIYHFTHPSSFDSQAPFHPTPDGQESIAEHVVPVVRSFYPEQGGITDTTAATSSAPPTTG